MKTILAALLLSCTVSHAEWYRVQFVESYNTIRAAQAAGDAEPIVIRIRNLEKIEYIQPDPDKVLLGGVEAESLAKGILLNQLVWVDNLKAEEGAYVADVYPAFEQVVTAYRNHRILNGDNLSAATKEKLKIIYKQMVSDMNLSPVMLSTYSEAQQFTEDTKNRLQQIYQGMLTDIRNNSIELKGDKATDLPYESEFGRTMFTAEALIWFRNNGQKMHPSAQKLYIDLLQSFQTDATQNARYTQFRLETLRKQQSLFFEMFINDNDFERGKFTYTCLEWFKNRGQYLPTDVQDVFINWLRLYQQTNSSDNGFMRDRLKWMIENNDLYFDFIQLGN